MEIENEIKLAESLIASKNFLQARKIYIGLLPKTNYSWALLRNVIVLSAALDDQKTVTQCFIKAAKISSEDVFDIFNIGIKYLGLGNILKLFLKYKVSMEQLSDQKILTKILNIDVSEEDKKASSKLVKDGNRIVSIDRNEAQKTYITALQLDPKNLVALNNLSVLLRENKEYYSAEFLLNVAVSQNAAYLDASWNLASTYIDLKRLDEATKLYQLIIEQNPQKIEAYIQLSHVYMTQRYNHKAVSLLEDALKIHFNNERIRMQLGHAYRKMGAYKSALDTFQAVSRDCDEYIDAKLEASAVHRELGELKEARKIAEEILLVSPEHPEAQNLLAAIFSSEGNQVAAKELYRKIIFDSPSAPAHVFKNYVSLETMHEDQIFFDMIEERLLTAKNSDKVYLHFSMAKYQEDLKNYDASFYHYEKGNRLKRSETLYKLESDLVPIQRSIQITNKLNVPKFDRSGTIPIFILGMPRSGSTLLEQILSSHTEITGLGELNYANLAVGYSDILNSDKFEQCIVNIRTKYFSELQKHEPNTTFVTDKMPLNFRWIGILSAAIPEAKFIHIHRDPMAVCWSNYTKLYTSDGNTYTHDLKDLGKFYSAYVETMMEWERILPNKIQHIAYERILSDKEICLREICDYLELNVQDTMLDHTKNKKSINTASASQARKAIYHGSNQTWTKFERHLDVLKINLKYHRNPTF